MKEPKSINDKHTLDNECPDPFATLLDLAGEHGEISLLEDLATLAELNSEDTDTICEHHRKFYATLSLELKLLAGRMSRLLDQISEEPF